MLSFGRYLSHKRIIANRNFPVWLAGLAGFLALGIAVVSCGGGPTTSSTTGTGSITVNLTDPPSCAFPNGLIDHVWVTINSVQAHMSASAGDNSPGWVELAPQLNSVPKQIDLFSLASNACLLTTLGNTSLPAGTYQQIRLMLVSNSGQAGATSPPACQGQGFNCVVLHDGSVHQLLLSSQANTGLKIPPGQIIGGPISVGAGQSVDLNINFNTCASLVQEGTGQFRLKPALTAGQVSTNTTGISGRIVDATTQAPISVGASGAVLVALEQPDATGTDVILRETTADAAGNFNFCPLPSGPTYDVVAVAINANGAAYNATIAVNVPNGMSLNPIPLSIETSSPNTPVIFQGVVSATGGSASIDASVSALQALTLPNIGTRSFTIPAEAGNSSVSNISVVSNTLCPSGAPSNTNCAMYSLVEPASNPRFAVFANGAISPYSLPVTGLVPYSIRADAAVPLGGGTSSCSPSSITVNTDTNGNALNAFGGAVVPVKTIGFSGCS
ncbi:MAG TPA: DUF4382 domain-containing protein [Candidatus Acidoferrales bacterium]|jgi:hypothetical protein|nr:DUF4382 domain-containing protein [Candidatus Acidoferrales bacterium]